MIEPIAHKHAAKSEPQIAIENKPLRRNMRFRLVNINVVTGATAQVSQASHRALGWLADWASGRVISSLAREGGLDFRAVGRAGACRGDGSLCRYPVQGAPHGPGRSACSWVFASDDFLLSDRSRPADAIRVVCVQSRSEIKREVVWSGPVMRPATVWSSENVPSWSPQLVVTRDSWENFEGALRPYESV
jgi:hypothetical protein